MIKKISLVIPLLVYAFPLIAFGDVPFSVITDVYRLEFADKNPSDSHISLEEYNEKRRTAGINDTVVIEFSSVQTLIDKAKCTNQPSSCKIQTINLYFDGKKIAVRDPNEGSLGRKPETIEFDLQYDSSANDSQENWADLNKKNWASLLGSPTLSSTFFQHPVNISVGLNTGPTYEMPQNITGGRFNIRRIDTDKFVICILLLIVISGVVLWSNGIKQKIREALSDIGPPPPDSQLKPWSLARCQMAFWFVLVAVSFLSIWVVTGALDTITGSVLALIGIGSGTALGSAMIDVSADSQAKIEELQIKEQKLTTDILSIDAKLATPGIASNQKTHLESLKKLIEANVTSTQSQILKRNSPSISQGFWNDLLNDQEGGAGFHRIQMFVWTLILGCIFVYSVWKSLSMPEFSETLLALQGLSAGTYLGFKIPDKKS